MELLEVMGSYWVVFDKVTVTVFERLEEWEVRRPKPLCQWQHEQHELQRLFCFVLALGPILDRSK